MSWRSGTRIALALRGDIAQIDQHSDPLQPDRKRKERPSGPGRNAKEGRLHKDKPEGFLIGQKMEILHRYTNACLWSGDTETIREAVEKANLGGANLRGANLGGADLVGADLVGADLGGADLGGANLGGANLGDANLFGADLGGADLGGANLGGADLVGANLFGADLFGADLGGADLGGANLGGADLVGANLGGADLVGADLVGADLVGADLGGANLFGADLGGADLGGANLGGYKIFRILSIGPIGSRKSCLVAWLMEDGTRRYSTGCQVQIEESAFLARVQEKHGDNEHAKAYRSAVEFARALADGAGKA